MKVKEISKRRGEDEGGGEKEIGGRRGEGEGDEERRGEREEKEKKEKEKENENEMEKEKKKNIEAMRRREIRQSKIQQKSYLHVKFISPDRIII